MMIVVLYDDVMMIIMVHLIKLKLMMLLSIMFPSSFSQPRLPDAVIGSHTMPAYDAQWVDNTSKKAALKLERLDMDLKNYKTNSIKESIR